MVRMTLIMGFAPDTPKIKSRLGMVRDKTYKVRLSTEELEVLKNDNVQNIARFLRESGLNSINKKKQKNLWYE